MDGHLDGNALAGPLSEALRLDPTVAVGRCGGCGDTRPLAAMIVYSSAMGQVGRCATCGNVLLTLVQTPTSTFLSTSGLTWLRFTSAPAS